MHLKQEYGIPEHFNLSILRQHKVQHTSFKKKKDSKVTVVSLLCSS